MHGTLELTYMAVKFNFQQVLLKTLIPTMNALKDTAVLNIKTDGKCAPDKCSGSSATEQIKVKNMITTY